MNIGRDKEGLRREDHLIMLALHSIMRHMLRQMAYPDTDFEAVADALEKAIKGETQ